MMSAFIIIFPLLSSGVFGDDDVTVMEGDSVTLHADTKIQIKEIDWRFGENLIASIDIETSYISFEGPSKERLKLDNHTGDLKITNIRISDAGSYNLQVNSEQPPSKKFTVNVVSVDQMPSVLMGEFVTLNTGVFEPKKYDVIRWRFGDQKSSIAEVNRASGNTSKYVADGRFRDRLQLDYWTGSLTITHTKPTDSGEYEVDIIASSRETIHKSFSVTVSGSDEVRTVSVIQGEPITLNPDGEHKDDKLMWMFRGVCIAERKISVPDDVPDGRFRVRPKLDDQTGSLTITDTTTEHTGVYELLTSRPGKSSIKKFIVCVFDQTDDIKTVSVKKGESVKLETGVDDIKTFEEILWRFGLFTLLAELRGGTNISPLEDRVKMDHQTGSLTINKFRPTDAGIYMLRKIEGGNITTNLFRVEIESTDNINNPVEESVRRNNSENVPLMRIEVP
ncbi:uncharacterized protein LOC130086895 [Rhinichthys klamathensis goyatoka]|uniref:uncharacterized protein LOC130086895 n=1 Tax=Rhinichthys klamathensis goyatoka TaxID=3034132 RepID=UPI0024B4FB09|nr:uncharacterized protein LOC130086895 [Rhinichthys klamathensis goyatoka]